jgi:hypothetical protein
MNENEKDYKDLDFDPYVIDDSFEEALTYEKVFGKENKKEPKNMIRRNLHFKFDENMETLLFNLIPR